MPKLVLSMDGLVLKEITLNKERTTIGRKPINDIQIDNLAISGQHAVITCILDDAFLEDQNSTNGTYVNGQPIKKHVLQNNDVVELGKYRLKFIADTLSESIPTTDLVETVALKPFDIREEPEPEPARRPLATETLLLPTDAFAQAEASINNQQGVIRVIGGANVGRELPLTKPLTTLGKPGHQVAVISRTPHGHFITHVEGPTQPIVNGQTIGTEAHQLSNRDTIEIAGVKMEFFLR